MFRRITGFFQRLWDVTLLTYYMLKWTPANMAKVRMLDVGNLKRKGDVAVITGGNRGIGIEVVKILLKCEMDVIIGCRKVVDGENAVERIRSEGIHTGTVKTLPLDLMSLTSVRNFANQILAMDIHVSILINNGTHQRCWTDVAGDKDLTGIMFPPYMLSEDGYESQLQINYLSHFLLTTLLIPKLADSGQPDKCSRIINVSSLAHFFGKINFDDLQMKKHYFPERGYGSSKLMQVISTVDMDARLSRSGMNVRSYSVHPGVVNTGLFNHMLISNYPRLMRFLGWTPEEGAQTSAYAALSPDMENEGGVFLANSRICKPSFRVYDSEVQRKLLKVSCDLVGLTEQEFSALFLQKNQGKTDTLIDVFLV